MPYPAYPTPRRPWLTALTLCVALAGAISSPRPALAEPALSPPVELRGTTTDGAPFDLTQRRGRVVMVVLWSTGCAVCRDKMAELRANARGWVGQPFEVVLLNTDANPSALAEYERLLKLTVPAEQRLIQLWRGAPGHRDTFGPAGTLPSVLLIDKQGRLVEQHHGRVPAPVWDRVAELL